LLLRPWEHARWRPTPNQFTLVGGALGVLAAVVALAAPDVLAAVAAGRVLDAVRQPARLLRRDAGAADRADEQPRDAARRDDRLHRRVSFWLAMSIRTAPPNWGCGTVPAALSIVLSILIHTGLYDHMRIRFGVLVKPPEPRVVATPPLRDAPARRGCGRGSSRGSSRSRRLLRGHVHQHLADLHRRRAELAAAGRRPGRWRAS
jgi:hypothetical protein